MPMTLGDIVRRVVIDPRKLTEYALDPDNPIGRHKARVFERAPGFTKGNDVSLARQLETKALAAEASLHASREPAVHIGDHVKDPERFGVSEIRDGRIVGVEEKPQQPKSSYAVTGIYLYDAYILEAVERIAPSARGELEISDAHQYLIDKGYQVSYREITGWWKDTGKPEDLLEANRLILDRIMDSGEPSIMGAVGRHSDIAGKVVVEAGATIVRRTIRGPAVIGSDTIIRESYIGPFTSIAHACEISRSEVEYSIILAQAKILEAPIRIERSILGREAMIVGCSSRPRTQKFIVGDHSRIELA